MSLYCGEQATIYRRLTSKTYCRQRKWRSASLFIPQVRQSDFQPAKQSRTIQMRFLSGTKALLTHQGQRRLKSRCFSQITKRKYLHGIDYLNLLRIVIYPEQADQLYFC